MEEVRMPVIGEKFPSLQVKTTHEVKKLPDDYTGKWFVLFSHPADFTPVCLTYSFRLVMQACFICSLIWGYFPSGKLHILEHC